MIDSAVSRCSCRSWHFASPGTLQVILCFSVNTENRPLFLLADFFSAGYADLKKPVWKGVFCHLMGDKAFYYKSYCVDDPRAMEDYRREVGEIEVWDSIKWRNSKTGRIYYEDYNILNRRIEDEFGVLERLRRILPGSLVNELLEGFAVVFSAAGDEPVYMDLENIRKAIAVSRVLCRRLEEGKAEEAIRFFDGNRPDEAFRDSPPDGDGD